MLYEFGTFTLDTEARQLVTGRRPLPLSGRAFELLRLLIEHRPRAINKRELRDHLWPDTFVVDASLPVLVREIRMALGAERHAIRTVYRFGYAFAADVRERAAGESVRDGHVHLLVHSEIEFRLTAGENVVGRDPAADVFIPSTSVSRRHAGISTHDQAAIANDLKSKNGTRVDGVRITAPCALWNGCIVRFGSIELVYRFASADTETETASSRS